MKTITGNTYKHKEAIKALGGKWNKAAKGWDVPDDKEEAIRAMMAESPAPRRRTGYVSYEIQTSGGTFYRNYNGRCEDAPCCGCCTI
jgi:hypothetical protein